ncbi:hypothetical protein GOB29_28735 [Sinorhizobium meliloti]|nr:hypothetical protein [Sinorhizobium meliloti]
MTFASYRKSGLSLIALLALLASWPAMAQSINGTVAAQNRSFHDTLSGPGAKMFAGVSLDVAVTSGQADINFVHRERRKCKWYGKCWYERWIDHNFKASGEWPIEYRIVNSVDPGDVVASERFENGKGRIVVPMKALRAYGSSYVLQARFAGDIDPNRTSGAFSVTVTVDAGPRIADFPRFLNNGSFLPSAADLSSMLQLDTWSTKLGADLIVKSLVNYAQSSFPTASDSEEHFRLLEIARSLAPNSTQVSRALANHYVDTGDYATAGDELRKTIKNLEEDLKKADNKTGRTIRIGLAEAYAQLAALAEREGSLLTTADYAKMDTLFGTGLEYAKLANGRDALARIHTNRAKILRKSNRVESLAAAVTGFQEAGRLLGKPLDETFLSVAPDQRYALFAATPMSTGIVFEPVESLAGDIELEGKPLPAAKVRTNKGLKPLDLSNAGYVLVDDGGVLSRLMLDDFSLETIDNVQFVEAQTFLNGVLGRSRDKSGSLSLQYIYGSQAPAALGDIDVRNADNVIVENESNWMYSASPGSDSALLIKRGLNPEIRLYKFSALGASKQSVVPSITDGEVTIFALSDKGDRFAAIVKRADRYDLVVAPIDGSDYKVYYTSINGTDSPVPLGDASGIVFAIDGNYIFTVSGNRMLSVNLRDAGSQPVDTTLNLLNSQTKVSKNNFGRDNTGAIVAGAVDHSQPNGFVFRMPLKEDGTFDLNHQRYPLSNRVLEIGLPVFVNVNGKNFVGVARPSESEVSVLDISTGLALGRRAMSVTNNLHLLTGGRYVVTLDDIANAALIYDIRSTVEPSIIAASTDLAAFNLEDDRRQKLYPRVVAGRVESEWFVLWTNIETDSIDYVSRYIGPTKDGSTMRLDISQYQTVVDAIRATADKLGETNPRTRFSLSDRLVGVGGRDTFIITLRSALSDNFAKAQLDPLTDDLKGLLEFPVIDLANWPAEPFMVMQPRNSQIIAYDARSHDIMRSEAKAMFLRKGDGSVDAPLTFAPEPDSVVASGPIFLPHTRSDQGNLYGGAAVYLLNKGGRLGLRYTFLDAQSGVEVPCVPCEGQWADENLSQILSANFVGANWVSSGSREIVVASEQKLLLYTKGDLTPRDELPAAVPVSIFSADRHLTTSSSARASIFNRVSR